MCLSVCYLHSSLRGKWRRCFADANVPVACLDILVNACLKNIYFMEPLQPKYNRSGVGHVSEDKLTSTAGYTSTYTDLNSSVPTPLTQCIFMTEKLKRIWKSFFGHTVG